MMSKKHFIALADAMRRARPEQGSNEYQITATKQWEQDVRHVANFCQGQNPNFNYDRWMGYIEGTCGPNGGSK
jgi:hypothetical protein